MLQLLQNSKFQNVVHCWDVNVDLINYTNDSKEGIELLILLINSNLKIN